MKRLLFTFVIVLVGCGGGSTGIGFNFDVHMDSHFGRDVIASENVNEATVKDVSDTLDRKETRNSEDVTTPVDVIEAYKNDVHKDLPLQGEDLTVPGEDVTNPKEGVKDVPVVTDVYEISPGFDGSADNDVEVIQGCPGADGCPCHQNKDCSSRLCTETRNGFFCASVCDTDSDCDKGFVCHAVNGIKVCIDPHPVQCMPCTKADACKRTDGVTGLPEAKCVLTDIQTGSFCLYPCDGAQCESGYKCDDSSGSSLCTPENSECRCYPLAVALGAFTECTLSSASQCKGTNSCTKSGALTGCQVPEASPEACDGKDNDCDGQTDEDWPDLKEKCSVGKGQCQAWGQFVCKPDGSGVECSAKPNQPSREVCDGKDNDCDGKTDEDLPTTTCSNSNNLGTCTGVQTCIGGAWVCNAPEPTAERCDGKDNDCDGKIDEDWPRLDQPCSAGQGACQVTGKWVCKPDGSGVECNAHAGTGTPEVCDGKDDDCNGETDDGVDLPGCKEYCRDNDHDRFGNLEDCECLCKGNSDYPVAKSGGKDDCDDSDPTIYPGADGHICGKDKDCDGNLLDQGEECDDGNTTDWDGCNTCQIAEFKVDDQTILHGVGDPAVAGQIKSGYVVVWPQGTSMTDISLAFKRFGTDGKQIGDQHTAITSDRGYLIGNPSVCWMDKDKFVVAWMFFKVDSSNNLSSATPYVRVFKADGTPLTDRIRVSSSSVGVNYRPRVACGDSGFAVAWANRFTTMGVEVYRAYYRFFASDGKALDRRGHSLTGLGTYSFNPEITHIGYDRYVIAYRSNPLSSSKKEVNLQVVSYKDGSLAEKKVVSGDALSLNVAVSNTGTNNFAVGWVDKGTLRAQPFRYKSGSQGIEASAKKAVNISLDECPKATIPKVGMYIENNDYKLTWVWQCRKDNNFHVRIRTASKFLQHLGNQIDPAKYNTMDQKYPAAAGIRGQFMVVWSSFEATHDGSSLPWFTAVAAQRFDGEDNRIYH